MNQSELKELAFRINGLLGFKVETPEVRDLLQTCGFSTEHELDPEESTKYLEDKSNGFCLLVEDNSIIPRTEVRELPAGTLVLIGSYLYAQDTEGYAAFVGELPLGIHWSDGLESLSARLGEPQSEIRSKKTGRITAQRWNNPPHLVTASYKVTGELESLYLGFY